MKVSLLSEGVYKGNGYFKVADIPAQKIGANVFFPDWNDSLLNMLASSASITQ
ncbi:hypothetical protein [Comamonas odontotermitis]|uniref:hypothetical protein n=1 Tax=Comamonas odontotermitis TaxID=379895 RepID=UPI001CC3C8E5|nr:hypothetical protein [Comamonas odontotermitis]UBB16148.1 hypothetical protein LAD35_15140 [Comamonas odontotermitis]